MRKQANKYDNDNSIDGEFSTITYESQKVMQKVHNIPQSF